MSIAKQIQPFESLIAVDDYLLPEDLNVFTEWSLDWQDVWKPGHRTDGSHSERVVPSAAAILTSGGAVIASSGFAGGGIANPGAGNWTFNLDPDLASAEKYAVFAWTDNPSGGGTLYFVTESERNNAKTASNFEIEIFDQASVLTNRDAVVLVFGPRPGEA